MRIEVAEDFEHPEAVVDVFAEAENAAAADGHACLLCVADGAEAVVEGVGGDDVRVMLGRGVDVVIVGGDTGVFQLARFGLAELAERHTHFHAERGDVAHDVEDVIEFLGAAAHAFPGRSHAEACGAAGLCGAGFLHHLFLFHELLALHAGAVARALGAVAAVFAASAGLDGEEGAELHFVLRPVFLMHGAGLLEETEEGLVVDAMEF